MSMPVVFIGHGSPMNLITSNEWTRTWHHLGRNLPLPRAIVMVSAHWYGPGLWIQGDSRPEMLYDMIGFPEELYRFRYPAENPLWLQERIQTRLPEARVVSERGYDHGAYAVMAHLFPDASIPVCQVCVNSAAAPATQISLGKRLSPLREEGVLIIGSGNVVHNLGAARPDASPDPEAGDFDAAIREALASRDRLALEDFMDLPGAVRGVPTPDHFYPLLTVFGASRVTDQPRVFNQAITMGTISMTSYLFGDIKETLA